MAAIDEGSSVLVAAPTSSGKTVVAEHAIDQALAAGRRTFYTTPIKALSNQKFRDLGRRLGADRVGLLTGDNSIDGDAPVVVMTTEILRNMLYAGSSDVDDVGWVILDEIHFLEDPYRGPVWEEVVLELPAEVGIVALSATVSNADELGGWLREVRGPTEVVVEHRRPVPLRLQHLVAERRRGRRLRHMPILVKGRANPDGRRFDEDHRHGGRRGEFATPRREEVVAELRRQGLLPAIHFVFSRLGCDEARDRLLSTGTSFNDREEQDAVDRLVDRRLADVPPEDLRVLDGARWRDGLRRGVASHHAGLIPIFKEVTEELFAAGLLSVVYATETLALGVNLPARAVVIDKLTKFTGEGHDLLTAGQFTQLTGRAGRRGLDDEGHAVVLWSPFVRFDQVAGLAASTEFRLRSAFAPTYNMVANLMSTRSRDQAEALLARSFGQYQAGRLRDAHQERLAAARAALAERRDRRAVPGDDRGEPVDPRGLRPGDVVLFDDGQAHTVLSVANRGPDRLRLRAAAEGGALLDVDVDDLAVEPRLLGAVELPVPFLPNDRSFRREVNRRARRFATGRPAGVESLRSVARLQREVARLESLTPPGDLVGRLSATVAVLEARAMASGWALTAKGGPLVGIYNEADLLVVEALGCDLFAGLSGPELAAVVSALTYQRRGPGESGPCRLGGPAADRLERLAALAEDITRTEHAYDVDATRPPDTGFAEVVYGWAAGGELHELLDGDLNGGEFVRNVRLVVDLLSQLRKVGPADLARSATDAIEALERGVVRLSVALGGADEEATVGVDGP